MQYQAGGDEDQEAGDAAADGNLKHGTDVACRRLNGGLLQPPNEAEGEAGNNGDGVKGLTDGFVHDGLDECVKKKAASYA